jgi:hypothetical protein
MKIPILTEVLEMSIPKRIKNLIKRVLNEQDEDAADEIIALSEEILGHIAARGFLIYLRHDQQKQVHMDFLLNLFSIPMHHNAGPLYRQSVEMVRDCPALNSDFIESIYRENGKYHERIHHFSDLRNRVMHGFFVLPPEENQEEAQHLGELLKELSSAGFFDETDDLHFFGKDGFTGRWSINTEDEWRKLSEKSWEFGSLCQTIVEQKKESFWEEHRESITKGNRENAPEEIKYFVNSNQKGSFALWVHPTDRNRHSLFADVGAWLSSQSETLTIAYRMEDVGITFSMGFLIERLVALLDPSGKSAGKKDKPKERLQNLRKNDHRKIVVLIDMFNTALFSPDHVSQSKEFLSDNNILLIAIVHRYSHLERFFNKSLATGIRNAAGIPPSKERKYLLENYLRFKGPFEERKEDWDDYNKLRLILEDVCNLLQNGVEVIARRYADKNGHSIESVHEVFAVLQPWIPHIRRPFEEDMIDEILGYPSAITETTPIYLTLGRRDLKLEYRHRMLILHSGEKD